MQRLPMLYYTARTDSNDLDQNFQKLIYIIIHKNNFLFRICPPTHCHWRNWQCRMGKKVT
jgi:hypothetical protein